MLFPNSAAHSKFLHLTRLQNQVYRADSNYPDKRNQNGLFARVFLFDLDLDKKITRHKMVKHNMVK